MHFKKNRTRRIVSPDKDPETFFSDRTAENTAAFFAGRSPVQPKLAFGSSNDAQEKEAESMAKHITEQPVQKAEKKEEEKPVQKAEKKEEEKPVQKAEKKEEEKPVQKAEKKEEEKPVQKAEKKEDEQPVQKMEKKEEEQPVQKMEKKEEEKPVQKAEKKEEEKPVQKMQKRSGVLQMVQRKQAASNETDTSNHHASFEEMLLERKGTGTPLSGDILEEMERKFDADFSAVRIHTDDEAIDMCNSVHALAFAHGYDIYFNKGQFNPQSSTGKELLAHELTHVVQQNGKGK